MSTATVMSDRKVCLTCSKWSGKRRSFPRKGQKGTFRVEADEGAKAYCKHFGSRTDPLYGCSHHETARF